MDHVKLTAKRISVSATLKILKTFTGAVLLLSAKINRLP